MNLTSCNFLIPWNWVASEWTQKPMTCCLNEETCVNKRKVLLTIWLNNGISGAMMKTLVRRSTLPLSHTQLGPLSAPHTASLSLSTRLGWKNSHVSVLNSQHYSDGGCGTHGLYLKTCQSIAGYSQHWSSLQTFRFYLPEQHHSPIEFGSPPWLMPQSQDSSVRSVFLWSKDTFPWPSSTEWSQTTLR